jgi:glutamyl-tRNA synthetase
VKGSTARILDDLETLGLVGDELDRVEGKDVPYGPYTQSLRTSFYEERLARLGDAVYPCDCSRAEVARAASAPHAGEEVVYPGTCRDKPRTREMKREPSWRLRVPEGTEVSFDDLAFGPSVQRVDLEVGDFVLRRGDGVFSYQWVCALDDSAMHIDIVARGSDLHASTARQILIAGLAGETHAPRYWHLPLVVAPNGERVAKRTQGTTVRELLSTGLSKEVLFGFLGHAAGLFVDAKPRDLARSIEEARSLEQLLAVPRVARVPEGWGSPAHRVP